MASHDGSSLEEHITCSVCLEIYTNPHILKCLHTFCYDCIENLKQDTWVRCPQCREKTTVLEIKRDFKIQSFIDVHNKSAQKESLSTTVCDACQDPGKAIDSFCRNCEEFLCVDCVKAHRGSKASRDHILSLYSDICQVKQNEIEKYVNKFKSKWSEVENDRKSLNGLIVDITNAEVEQIAEVNRERERINMLVDQHHDNLIQEIRCRNASAVDTLKMCEDILEDCSHQLDAKITSMSDAMQSTDLSLLTDTLQDLSETGDRELQKLHEDLPKPNHTIKSPLTVTKGEDWDPDKSTHIMVDATVKMPVLQDHMKSTWALVRQKKVEKHENARPNTSTLQSSEETQQPYSLQEVKCTQIMYRPTKLPVKDDQVWVGAGKEGIFVYNLDLCQVKHINHSTFMCVNGVLKTTRDVVVCDQETGLHQLTHEGDYLNIFSRGNFSDVCIHNDILYALDFKKGVIYTCINAENNYKQGLRYFIKKSHYIWVKTRQWKLPLHTYFSENDKLCATSAGVYLSCFIDDSVLAFSHTGEFMCTMSFGDQLEAAIGPNLSDVDSKGRMLVCHYHCNRLAVVCPSTMEWWAVTGLEGLCLPLGAVVGDKHLWVAAGDTRESIKLKKYEVGENETCTAYFDRIMQSIADRNYGSIELS